MKDVKAAKKIILIEKLRLIESELFRLGSKYGVKTADQLDQLIAKGKLSEEAVGENLYLFDHLISEREKAAKELAKLKVKRASVWKNLQNLPGLPKLSFRI